MSFLGHSKICSRARRAQGFLKNAFDEARNRKTVSRGDRSLLHAGHGPTLVAVNRHSHELWGRAVCDQLSGFFCSPGSVEHNREVYFVTLVDINCATSVSAPDIDIEAIKNRLRSGLRGLSFFGVIEPAYYTNLQAGVRFAGKRCLFWHLHALVWGISRKKLRALLRVLEASGRYLAIAANLKGTNAKKVRQGDLPKVVGYMLKPPSVAHRVTRRDAEGPNGEPIVNADGEVLAHFIQGKSELRKGERVRLFHALKSQYLDKLAVAGGEGGPLLARAKRVALARWVRRCRPHRPSRRARW